ncbi:MAG: hypothetical protein J6P84_05400 [Alphaproteobacteria bacterium]|nr:hypothetical protein [Alphaproteobacteria bacterium]
MYVESLKNEQKPPFYIAEFEQSFKACKSGTSYTVYKAYHKSKEAGKDLIDFNDMIWPDDVEAIVATLRGNNIREFTISCGFCDMIDRLVDFEKLGCTVEGTTKIKTGLDGILATANALKMRIC